MSPRRLARAAASLALLAALAACGPGGKIKLPFKLPSTSSVATLGFDKDALDGAIDSRFGGVGTCVILADTAGGAEVYRYNSNGVCTNKMPPCETYAIAGDLVGLDAGVVTPTTTMKWDGTPQPASSWQHDTDFKTAFQNSVGWWQGRIAQDIGQATLKDDLRRLGYGNGDLGGALTSFWMGPSVGGQLGLSTREQAQFLHRLYAGQLPVKAASAQAVEAVMPSETRGASALAGLGGDCATLSDSSREVAWYIGRLKTDRHDWVFAASLEGDSKNYLPGLELEHRVKSAFAQAGLWPAA